MFKGGGESIVVVIDVVACGFDVDGIIYVVNYDLFDDIELYVYRIGRIGRMGRKGEVWSFVISEDCQFIEKISLIWNFKIFYVDVFSLFEGMDRDFIGRRDDWEEVFDLFGMVIVRFVLGKLDLIKRVIVDWIVWELWVFDIVIGEIL